MAFWLYHLPAERGGGLVPKNIHGVMVATLIVNGSALSTMHKMAVEFRIGSNSFEDDPRYGRTAAATTEENVDCVHHMVLNASN